MLVRMLLFMSVGVVIILIMVEMLMNRMIRFSVMKILLKLVRKCRFFCLMIF